MRFGVFPRTASGWRPSSALGTRRLEAQGYSRSPKPSVKTRVRAEAGPHLHRGARCSSAKQTHCQKMMLALGREVSPAGSFLLI